jgi:signal transduction histidine kinase/ActR/RegA family two-component response regulator
VYWSKGNPTSQPRPHLHLRTLLLLLAAGVALPVVAFAAIVVWQLVGEQRLANERRLIQTIRTQAAAVDRETAATVRTLQALAHSEKLEHGDLAGFYTEARRVKLSQPAWYNIILFAPDGQELINLLRPWGDPLPKLLDTESFQRVIDTRAPTVGSMRRGPIERRLGFPVRVPVIQNNEIRAVLTAVISPERFADALSRDLPPTDEWTRTIFDASGTVVASTQEPQRFVGQQATASFLRHTRGPSEGFYRETTNGHRNYVAFNRSPWGWTTTLAIPVDALDGPLHRSMLALVGIGLLAFLISATGAFVLSDKVTRDIEAAADAAQALARGVGPPFRPSVVTEVRRLAASLERSGQLLADRERERDEHLMRAEAARRDAETANRTKDQFLAMLGHELRNPLSPIVTALQLLRLRGGVWSRELAIVERQVSHLIRLVDDLLDVSRITRGKIELKQRPIEIHTVVTRAVEMTSPLFEERQHRLALEVPAAGLVVDGDPDRLAQVFANLLANAAKYTPSGGHVTIRGRRDHDDVAVDIVDDGQGLPSELLPHVFELFVQGPRASDRREGGLGLGLTLVRSLVALHNGRVEAHSDGASRGSTFTVRLPVTTARPAAVPQPAICSSPMKPRRLLIVDDNADAAETLASVLRQQQHTVEIAYDGPGALALVDEFIPDVAVLDIGLPVMDGYEVAARLRDKMGASTPAFIALTGYGQPHDHARSRAAGFHDHFVKPVDVEALLRTIDAAAEDKDRASAPALS